MRLIGSDLLSSGENRHFCLFVLFDLLILFLFPLFLGLARSDGGAELAAVSAIFLADDCGFSLFIEIPDFWELLLIDRVFGLLELVLSFTFELDVGFLFGGDARLEAVHVHPSVRSACLSGGSFFGRGGLIILGFAVETTPAENILLLFFVFLAFGCFNFLGIFDHGGFFI